MPQSILLVDDERPLLALLATFLQRRGYDVAPCDTGQAALDLCRENPGRFQIAVLDLKLPDLPGDEVLIRLLETSPSIRVLISSGSAWTSDHLPPEFQPRTASILKPFMPKSLIDAMNTLLA